MIINISLSSLKFDKFFKNDTSGDSTKAQFKTFKYLPHTSL